MARTEKVFAGARIRAVREQLGLSQRTFAARLGLSTSYLSQMEADLRPITVAVLMALGREFAVDISEFVQDRNARLASDLREVYADALLSPSAPSIQELKRTVANTPAVAQSIIRLHMAYREQHERLQAMDEAINADRPDGHLLPWEEARDYFHYRENYVDELDRAAEQLAAAIGDASRPEKIEAYLADHHGVEVKRQNAARGVIRRFAEEGRILSLAAELPIETAAFQLAYQLAVFEFGRTIDSLAAQAELRSKDARELVRVALANYAAGALLMPYSAFAEAARQTRHDVEQLQRAFNVSFEQVCHRLSNLQRPGARGVPFAFVRVDMAGNITKRHSSARLQFARYGGTCPLWIVHEAVALPGRTLVQLAELPDGTRFIAMARGLVKPSGRFDVADRRYAVTLGCEEAYAAQFIYADAVSGHRQSTPIGVSCRICPRSDCAQRAFPPSDRRTLVDLHERTTVPYTSG